MHLNFKLLHCRPAQEPPSAVPCLDSLGGWCYSERYILMSALQVAADLEFFVTDAVALLLEQRKEQPLEFLAT